MNEITRWTITEDRGDLTIIATYNRSTEFKVRGAIQLSNLQPGIRISIVTKHGHTLAERVYHLTAELRGDVQYATDGSVVPGTRLARWIQQHIDSLLKRLDEER